MTKWMVTDMTHNNALITNAMLASYASEKNITYLQMIEPFVIYSLPTKLGSKIDVSKVAKNVYEEFGLDIKSKVVEDVLINISKVKTRQSKVRFLKDKSYYSFYVNQRIDNSDFDNKRNFMKSLVSDVVKSLHFFINEEENIIKKISIEEAESILINFLNNYNADVYKNIENIEKIKLKENILSYNYKVAKFIIHEYNSELGCFDKIKQIQEGYFASIALYNFFENIDNENNPKSTLQDTDVVLDTMLLVDALKLNTEYSADSMEELLLLITENGGALCTFDYYVDELCGIIDKYTTDSEARISLDLDFFRRHNTNVAEILLKSARIKSDVENDSKIYLQNGLEVQVLNKMSYDEMIATQNWHIDSSELEKIITSSITYTSDLSFRNDCSSIERILYEKEINGKQIIFLSYNSKLIYSARKFASKENKNLFYTDIKLASTIWLSNYNSKSKLSELKLLQNAYAALTPTKEILEEVLQIIENNLNASDEDLKKNALILRYDNDLLYHISAVVKNDKNNINQNTQNALIDSLTRKIRNDLKDSVEAEVNEKYKEVDEKLKNDANNINKRASKISVKEERLNKKEHDLNAKEESINARLNERRQIENELSSAKNELFIIKENIRKRNHIISLVFNILFTILVVGIYAVVSFVVTHTLLIYCLNNLIDTDQVNNIYQVCTFVSFFVSIGSTFLTYFKGIIKISKKIEEIIYHFLCKHSKYLKTEN